MQPTTKGDRSSALPMPGLSKRAQAQLAPKKYGQMPPQITQRNQGEIPNALKSRRG
jgi:hypothetical protein